MSHRMRPGTWLNVQGVCEADAALWAWWLQARVEMRLRIVDLDALDGADPVRCGRGEHVHHKRRANVH